MNELIIPIGLPGCGKTTLINYRYIYSHSILCLDDIRQAMGSVYNPNIESFVRAILETMGKAYMIRGVNIALDSTNTSKYIIEKWINLSREYGYNTKLIIFDTPIEVCKERQIHGCPSNVFERFYKQMKETKDWIYSGKFPVEVDIEYQKFENIK